MSDDQLVSGINYGKLHRCKCDIYKDYNYGWDRFALHYFITRLWY